MQGSVTYNLSFAAVVCVACAGVVSTANVSLRERHAANQLLEKQRNVLIAAGLATEDESLTTEEVAVRFGSILQVVVELDTGGEVAGANPDTFDQREVTSDPETSREAPENNAGLSRIPRQALGYELYED